MFRVLFHYLLLLLISRIDYITGAEVKLGSFYLLIVALASWNLRPRALIVFAISTVAMWSTAEWFNGVHFTSWMLYSWNICNRAGVVAITASMVFKAKITLTHQQRLIRELRQTLLKISQFKELVPVCRICHHYHFDPDYQKKLEEITRDDLDKETIGGICPECLAAREARLESIPVTAFPQPDPS